MKKFKLILLLLVSSVVFSSCEDFLNPKPIDAIGSESFYSNAAEVNAGIIAIYDGLQELPNMEYALTEMRSDNSKTRTSEGDWAQFEKLTVQPTNAGISTYWSNAYNVIFRANVVLPHLDVVTDATKRDQYEGEIRFVRAFVYFNLVRLWGDVPLVDKVIGPNETEYFGRKSTSDIYNFIIADLLAATEKLPEQNKIDFGRATKGAAQALLAKVYLTQKNFSAAKPLLESVIASTDYVFQPVYRDIFYTPRSKEIIFGIQYIEGDAKNGQAFSYAFTYKGRAKGLNWPTDNLFAAMDTAIDARKKTLFNFDPTVGSLGDWACGKYLSTSELAGNSWVYLRLADVYLMYCEAVLGGATSTSDGVCLEYINKIRTRANLPALSSITPDNLLLERRVELAFENHRFFDLVRFGKAESILEAFSLTTEGSFVFKASNLLLPIPQREINIYPQMTQNTGY